MMSIGKENISKDELYGGELPRITTLQPMSTVLQQLDSFANGQFSDVYSQNVPQGRKRLLSRDTDTAPVCKKSDQRAKENVSPPEIMYQGLPLMHSTPQMNAEQNAHEMYMHFRQQVPFFPQISFFPPAQESMFQAPFNSSGPGSTDSGIHSDQNSEMNHNDQEDDVFDDGEKVVPLAHEFSARPNADDKTPFGMVPGRMALLSASIKYKVTVGEIKRRIGTPECLHASLINGILRKAKSKDGGVDLRKHLYNIGIELPAGRRKSLPTTAFTALTEDEAVNMARDFFVLCNREFRSKQIAEHVTIEKLKGMHMDSKRYKQKMEDVKEFLSEMKTVMSSIGVHPSEYREGGGPISEHINHFSLVTHGFGHNAMNGMLQAMINIVNDSIKFIEHHDPQEASKKLQASSPPQMQLPPPGYMHFHPFMHPQQYRMGPQ